MPASPVLCVTHVQSLIKVRTSAFKPRRSVQQTFRTVVVASRRVLHSCRARAERAAVRAVHSSRCGLYLSRIYACTVVVPHHFRSM